ncbi:MAG: alginate export family protein [Oleispira sp.]|nr:alginate export family protein [Oleispira sp.]
MTIIQKNRFATKTVLASAISTALLAIAMPTQAQSFTEFAQEGDVIAEIRVRSENVKQDNDKDDAVAITARARIGYETASLAGFKALVEYDQMIILQDEYESLSSTGPNKDNTSVVADGAGGDFNRAQISYTHEAAKAVLGRQRIKLDNDRFVGNVGWRQNEQTYDAARIDLTAVENLNATYVYMNQVNDITYNDVAVKNHLLNLGYKTPVGKVVTYAYLLEEDEDNQEGTNDTFGLSFKGKLPVASVELLYAAEYATQTANAGTTGAKDFDAEYTFLEGGVKVSGVSLLAGYENLGGDGDSSFQTPLATKHAFNGWADVFLGTPTNGLNDIYAKAVGKVAGIKLVAVYHDFNSDKGGDNLGSEINLLAAKKFDDNFTAGIKYANYSAGDDAYGTVDTEKFWLWGEAKF